MIVEAPIFLRKGFAGMAIWPFIIVRYKATASDRLINHERIHLAQQAEMLVVFFYIWYTLEYIVRLIQYRDSMKAYKNISFEREAFANDADFDYLKKREKYSFLKYLKST